LRGLFGKRSRQFIKPAPNLYWRRNPAYFLFVMTDRPDISDCADAATFRQRYYLKEELVAFARDHGIQSTGGKFDIADRIAYYLDHGEAPPVQKVRKPTSKFAWHKAKLTDETVITDSYRKGPNVRRYFEKHIDRFAFSIPLMEWMKANVGKTLADAVVEAKRIKDAKRKGVKQPDQPHNQYNAYTRAYFAVVADGTQEEVRALWAERRKRPGPFVFHLKDLDLVRLPD